MAIEAIIFDLDNTIYPVASIGDVLFSSLSAVIEHDGRFVGKISDIKREIMRSPFQTVTKAFEFHDELTVNCLKHLSELTYEGKMGTFEDYAITRKLSCLKFLVTTGFTKLQMSKIDNLGIKEDFTDIFIVDPSVSSLTKKDVFRKIVSRYNLALENVLVIGDDIHSEIKAGKELGIKTVIYDSLNQYRGLEGENVIASFWVLEDFL